jgi:dienelactone hydrolase
MAVPPARFISQGRPVRIDEVLPPGPGPHAAALLLHGASGVGDGVLLRGAAKELAGQGIASFIVHYFDGLDPRGRYKPASPRRHAERERVIADALGFIALRPDVDAGRIAVFGLSLGGFHALSLAAQDSRVAAAVSMVGAMPRSVPRRGIARMPPVLILHGDRDAIVPVGRAREVARWLKRIGAPHEIKVYSGQGHVLRGPARADSFQRSAEFLARHLLADATIEETSASAR